MLVYYERVLVFAHLTLYTVLPKDAYFVNSFMYVGWPRYLAWHRKLFTSIFTGGFILPIIKMETWIPCLI